MMYLFPFRKVQLIRYQDGSGRGRQEFPFRKVQLIREGVPRLQCIIAVSIPQGTINTYLRIR